MRNDAMRDDCLCTVAGRSLGWCEYGDEGGWPIIHLHGAPSSRLEHPPAVAGPGRKGLRVIVPDRSGYGRTSPWPGRTLTDVAEDVTALADRLELERFDVIGFSGGGPHALACATRMPKRVCRVGLVSSLAPFEHTGIDQMGDGARQLWKLASTDIESFAQAFRDAIDSAGDVYTVMWNGAPAPDQQVLADPAVASAFRVTTQEGMFQGTTGLVEDFSALRAPWPFAVDRIDLPVWIWHGDHDLNAPISMGQWLEKRLPNAALEQWRGGGHFEMYRRWDEVLDPFAT